MKFDIEALERCVDRGMAAFDQLWPGWERRFELRSVVSIMYSNRCSQCIADLASGLPEKSGYLSLKRWCYANGMEPDDVGCAATLAAVADNCTVEYSEAIVAIWRSRILARAAHPVQVAQQQPLARVVEMALAK